MKVSAIAIRAVVLASVFSVYAIANAAVLHVPADHATIQAAVMAAGDGDVVLVAPGRYDEAIVIANKHLALRSDGGARHTILDGRDLAVTMVTIAADGPISDISVIEGFTLTGARNGAMNITGEAAIRDCVFVDNTLATPSWTSASALEISGAPSITDCTFIGNDHGAVALHDSVATFLRCAFVRNSEHAVRNWDGSPAFIDCHFLANRSSGDGGAIYNSNTLGTSEPSFIRCEFRGNVAGIEPSLSNGGALWGFNNSRPAFLDCRFERNRASGGGAVYNTGPTERFTHCTFIDNIANSGGAIHRIGRMPTRIKRCRFEGNTAGEGGAILLGYAGDLLEPAIIDSVFRDNHADAGGAIAFRGQAATVVNCVFDGNTAQYQGGALWTFNASPRVINSTFAGNDAGSGGAIFNAGDGSMSLVNSILWNNSPDQVFAERGASPTIGHCLVEGGWSGVGNIDADPLFIDLASGDVRLRRESPAIDLGDNEVVPVGIVHDIAGLARFIDGDGDGKSQVDLGAHEYARLCIANIAGNDNSVNSDDLLAVIASWGTCSDCRDCPADITSNCVVGVDDLSAVIAQWGSCP